MIMLIAFVAKGNFKSLRNKWEDLLNFLLQVFKFCQGE